MENQTGLNLEIVTIDIYRLSRTELIQLLNKYGVRAPITGDNCNGTLRPLASVLKSLVAVAQDNKTLEKALLALISRERDLTEDEIRRFRSLEELQTILKNRDKQLNEELGISSGEEGENSEDEPGVYENQHNYEKLRFTKDGGSTSNEKEPIGGKKITKTEVTPAPEPPEYLEP